MFLAMASLVLDRKVEKNFLQDNPRICGRNNRGVITCRHHGGGHQQIYRTVDFWRKKLDWAGRVQALEYDPIRNARLVLVFYEDG